MEKDPDVEFWLEQMESLVNNPSDKRSKDEKLTEAKELKIQIEEKLDGRKDLSDEYVSHVMGRVDKVMADLDNRYKNL